LLISFGFRLIGLSFQEIQKGSIASTFARWLLFPALASTLKDHQSIAVDATPKGNSDADDRISPREKKLGIAVSVSVFALNALVIMVLLLDRTVPSFHQSLMGILDWINSR